MDPRDGLGWQQILNPLLQEISFTYKNVPVPHSRSNYVHLLKAFVYTRPLIYSHPLLYSITGFKTVHKSHHDCSYQKSTGEVYYAYISLDILFKHLMKARLLIILVSCFFVDLLVYLLSSI